MLVADTRMLVTGGGSGLGEATVRMVVAAGGRAVIVDLPDSPAAGLAAQLGDASCFVPADVSDPEQVERAVNRAADELGGLDVVVNCAGVSPWKRVLGSDGALHSLELFRRAMDVNVIGLFDVIRHSAAVMARNVAGPDGERGLIVNVASIAGYEGEAGQTAYAASKGAVIALTLPLARDLAREGIRVMGVAPGMMDTAMIDAAGEAATARLLQHVEFPKRLGTGHEFANLVRTFIETAMLNGEVVRLDAAARL